MAMTLEERLQLAEDWKNRKEQKEEVSLDLEDKSVKGETPVLPEDNDITYVPNPEYDDNIGYQKQINNIKEVATRLHPDNIEQQNQYVVKKSKALDTPSMASAIKPIILLLRIVHQVF